MAHDEPSCGGEPTELVVNNIGRMLSGDMAQPILPTDALRAINGHIAAFGRAKDRDLSGAMTTIDA